MARLLTPYELAHLAAEGQSPYRDFRLGSLDEHRHALWTEGFASRTLGLPQSDLRENNPEDEFWAGYAAATEVERMLPGAWEAA